MVLARDVVAFESRGPVRAVGFAAEVLRELTSSWFPFGGHLIEGLYRTARSIDAIVINIGDTGPGMPPEVAERAFEAFNTTKDVGKGSGLGLDIARRIVVERRWHG